MKRKNDLINGLKMITWPKPKTATIDTIKILLISAIAGSLITITDTIGKTLVGFFI